MNIKQTVRTIVAGVAVFGAVFAVAVPQSATVFAASCGGVDTAILDCGGSKDATNIEETGIWKLLLIALNVLTAGVGVAALGGIVYGAVTYTSAGGNPDRVKKAKEIFVNVVIGVISFAAMYGLLNFLIPGGIFT
jgi:hypothetical protein